MINKIKNKEEKLKSFLNKNILKTRNIISISILSSLISISGCSDNTEAKKVETKQESILNENNDSKFDENWFIKARKNLKNENEVSDWYNSIKELFEKLNSMEKTQIEPLFDPYYFWEIDENWEKIPTFIIIWDIHADEWFENILNQKIKEFYWKKFLVENDESSKPEILAIEILNKKFWIKNYWLEGIIEWKWLTSKIWY